MNDNLFQRINDESAIQILASKDSCEPGYYWKWEDPISGVFTKAGVFETQEAALISAVNCLNDSYKTVVGMNDEVIIANKKLRLEATNKKTCPFWLTWLEEVDKDMLGLYFFMILFSVGIFGLAFLEFFLKSRCIPAT